MVEGAARFVSPEPRGLTGQQQQLYDAIVGGPRASGKQAFPLTDAHGALNGPFGLMLLQPGIGIALQDLGSAIRYRGTLSAREREIAILAVAAAAQSPFEAWAHERVAASVGMTGEEIESIALGTFVGGDARERVCHDFTRLLAAGREVTESEFADGVGALGAGELFELVVLAGYYSTLASAMRVFGVGVPEGLG